MLMVAYDWLAKTIKNIKIPMLERLMLKIFFYVLFMQIPLKNKYV